MVVDKALAKTVYSTAFQTRVEQASYKYVAEPHIVDAVIAHVIHASASTIPATKFM